MSLLGILYHKIRTCSSFHLENRKNVNDEIHPKQILHLIEAVFTSMDSPMYHQRVASSEVFATKLALMAFLFRMA